MWITTVWLLSRLEEHLILSCYSNKEGLLYPRNPSSSIYWHYYSCFTKRAIEGSILVKILLSTWQSAPRIFNIKSQMKFKTSRIFSPKITLSKTVLLLTISTKLLIFLSSSREPNEKDKSWFGIFWKWNLQFQITVSNIYCSEIVYFVLNRVKIFFLIL